MFQRTLRSLTAVIAAVALIGVSQPAHAQANELPERASVELLNPGNAPRQALRYDFQPGQAERMIMEMSMAMKMDAGGRSQTMTMPTMTMAGDIKVTEKTDEGFGIAFLFDEVSVADDADNPAMRQAMQKSLQGLKGLSGEGIMTNRGRTKDMSYEVPEAAGPRVRQQLSQTKRMMKNLGTLLPEEPVGEGAQWRVTMPLENQQFMLIQAATYTLKKINGDQLTLDVSIEQTAPEQAIKQGPLTKFEGRGEGSLTMSLNRLVPGSKIDHSMDLSQQMGQRTMDMTMDIGIEITPGDAAGE